MPTTRYPLLAMLLRRYFYSGWAFLIPYLAAYLLYYITGWPVNPPQSVAEGTDSSVLTPLTPHTSYHSIPSLLHLYWALHAIHLILAGAALWSWLQDRRTAARLSAASPYSLPATRYSLLTALAPWAILALIFYIPGVYLEWPSDPWEHLRRINEWRILDTVAAHSSWHKSSYFIPYSLLSWCVGLHQLFWLDLYYTGICLLLCWQYYRFSRACGLGERASMVFVIVQALLFGNNIFSFYRYYGISSSIYAQLGAIALTRIVLEFAARDTNFEPNLPRDKKVSTNSDTPSAHGLTSAPPSYSLLATLYSLLRYPYLPSFWHLPTIALLAPIALSLLTLTAFNHLQGLGIAALGIIAVIAWRLIKWRRSALWWLIGGTILINALFLWLYPRAAIIETYRAQGWLNAWYGFNILDLTSPASDRMLQILGFCGTISIFFAVFLFRRNFIIASLTMAVPLILQLPIVTVPLSLSISQAGEWLNIITFQRLFLACPTALAIIALFCTANMLSQQRQAMAYQVAVVVGLVIAVTVPPNGATFNRIWHSIQRTPADLALEDELSRASITTNVFCQKDIAYVGSVSAMAALNATCAHPIPTSFRPIGVSPAPDLEATAAVFSTSLQSEQPFVAPEGDSAIVLGHDPLFLNEERAWTVHSGARPEFVLNHDNGTTNSSFRLRTRPGESNVVFQRQLVRIDPRESYEVTVTVMGHGTPGATTYLAVAWHDISGNFLISSRREGGDPRGWSNGTHSYFGPVRGAIPTIRTAFSIKFGPGREAAIPSTARYFQVGAMLNYTSTSGAWVEISEVRLRALPLPQFVAIAPPTTNAFTPKSHAGQISMHWPDVQVVIDRGGSRETRILLNSSPPEQLTDPYTQALSPRRLHSPHSEEPL